MLITAGFVAFLGIQLVPYGRAHENPPIVSEPAWDSPRTRALAVTSCFDCHSNETRWPWYSNVAPFSWLLQRHVDEGREELNFSEWGAGDEADEIAESVIEGEMPTWDYVLIHPEANLSAADRAAFIDGLAATFGSGDGSEDGNDDDDD